MDLKVKNKSKKLKKIKNKIESKTRGFKPPFLKLVLFERAIYHFLSIHNIRD